MTWPTEEKEEDLKLNKKDKMKRENFHIRAAEIGGGGGGNEGRRGGIG